MVQQLEYITDIAWSEFLDIENDFPGVEDELIPSEPESDFAQESLYTDLNLRKEAATQVLGNVQTKLNSLGDKILGYQQEAKDGFFDGEILAAPNF